MRNKYIIVFSAILFLLTSQEIFAQDINDIGAKEVNQLKLEGKLTGKEQYTNRAAAQISNKGITKTTFTKTTASCNCWIERDSSFQIGQFDASGGSGGPGFAPDFRNDDWSTDTITLPFNICFYGTPVNKIFLNNNGNISIGNPYSTFTANSFPDPTYVMIAPFWADVDTRGLRSGIVYYSVTPTHLIVQWENVGYFGTHDEKLNTFQLIVTNGSDPILPSGQNVSFCYKDMQWTTGDASQGVFGFGGVPATVGVNRGNGFDYIQFGRFDKAGNNFDGAYGLNDGVDWLDNQTFTFNACILDANIAPVLNSLNICDTIRLCQNTTYQLTANYLSPEQGETTNINFSSGGMSGVSVLSITPGNSAELVLEIVGQTSNLGFHTVTVTAIDNGTPIGTTINNFVIEVLPVPLPSFIYSPSSQIMVNSIVNFTNTTPPGSILTWDFGDGSPTTSISNPQHIYATDGTFTAKLSALFPNGCITNTTKQIVVLQCYPATFNINNACVNTPTTISYSGGASSSAQYVWDFNGGTVLSGSGMGPYTVLWSVSGNYPITLSVTENACSSTVRLPVNVYQFPSASINALPQLCVGDSPNISFNGSAGASSTFTWNFGSATVNSGSGSGPFNVQWNNPGNDQISLIVSENGCRDTARINVQINPTPSANFIVPSIACANDLVSVSYIGTASPAANYVWDFVGGNIVSGSGQGPFTVTWKNDGNYLIGLTVIENGCTSALTKMPVAVTAYPVVSISPVPSLCKGETYNTTFTGITGAGSSFNWNFGNATILAGTLQGPYTLQWNKTGIDRIQLTVNNNGCIAQSFIDVLVNEIPTSDFVVSSSTCVFAPVLLNYTGTASANADYNWTFGGGTVVSGTASGPYSVSWNSSGVFTISLTVDENGCVSPQTYLPVQLHSLPVVFAGNDQLLCSGTTVTIGSPAVAGEIYLWTPATNLSDPKLSNTKVTALNTTNTIKQDSYILSTTDANGCVNTDTVLISSYPEPVINFTRPSSQCLKNNSFSFSALSNIPSGMNYSWMFSPEASTFLSIQSNVSINYSSVGTFPIVLRGDYNGCPAQSFTDSVSVFEMPAAEFFPVVTNGCEPLTVSFKNFSSGNGNTYSWNFGDGTSDNSNNAIHVYEHAGDYAVSLTTVNDKGCSVSKSFNSLISVYSKPAGQFISNPQIADILTPVVQFQNYSTNAIYYSWDFGDGFSSAEMNPNHTYSDIGIYNITLILISPLGCVDTVQGLVRVEDTFSFYIPNSFTPNGDGINDAFKGYGTSVKNYLMNIYNRWGKLIYSTDSYDKPWDGKVNSETVQNDVYIYRIVLFDQLDGKHTYEGDVSVIK